MLEEQYMSLQERLCILPVEQYGIAIVAHGRSGDSHVERLQAATDLQFYLTPVKLTNFTGTV